MVVKKDKKEVTTIQVEKELVETLRSLGHMGDTYSMVIRRLLNNHKGDAHDNRGDTDEPVGDRH